uniref:Uncharacterized protein n=1 Tax=Oryza barthii TaxID=65489 RepID=A0A0D3F2V0_9ORYZ
MCRFWATVFFVKPKSRELDTRLCSLFKWKQGNFHQERDIPHDFSRRTHQLGASVSGNWVPL